MLSNGGEGAKPPMKQKYRNEFVFSHMAKKTRWVVYFKAPEIT